MKKSTIDSAKIGTNFSLFYFYMFNNNYLLNSSKNKLSNYKNSVYYLINKLNTDFNLCFDNKNINYINLDDFINLFNKKLFNLPIKIIFSFLRGYYINNLLLYNTNITANSLNNEEKSKLYYFVLYDFHDIYLNYVYNFILDNTRFNPKIKFLIHTAIDKYSINELTDKLPYKLVFLHKSKYYNNIILKILCYLFCDIDNIINNNLSIINNNQYFSLTNILNEEELYIYNMYNSFKNN